MIKQYLMEKRSWIILFIFLQLLIIFVTYIDSSIPLTSILYIIFLSFIIFIIFLMIRYNKETEFFKSLEEREDDLDLTMISNAKSPFEKIIEKNIKNQTEALKKIASENQIALEQEKDQLLSWIHEIKTPLTAMHLMIDRLEDQTIKASLTYEWLRIHHLLDQQLHQKRIPFIQNDLYIKYVDIEALIFQEIKVLQSWCIQKGIGFNVDLEITEVLSDTKWVAFIMRQILTNAVKYSGSSDILIKSYEENEQVIIEVKDFGRGIDVKDVPRIFDKGFTSTSEHTDLAATGMGLYLAKKAAESLHIHINVHSELEIGTTFIFIFPKRNEFLNITGM